MRYYLEGHDRLNPVLQLLICLFPDEEHIRGEGEKNGEYVVSGISEREGRICAWAEGYWGARREELCPEGMDISSPQVSEYIRRSLYLLLSERMDKAPQWGMLTGVKPSKLALKLIEETGSQAEAERILQKRYFVSERRAALAIQTAIVSQHYKQLRRKDDIEVYVGIPFCPAKCSYCSFVSNDVRRWGDLVEPYLLALIDEIKGTGSVLKEKGRRIKSLYIGGGTPTILSKEQLFMLMSALIEYMDLSSLEEFTLEGGRPETITAGKLSIVREAGIGRISINPQTMNDDVLRGVGRFHTADDIRRCYHMAREQGSFEINMDLIAGLPSDDDEGLVYSVRELVKLEPENITLHCLARKKGAPLRFGKTGELSERVIDTCHDEMRKAGFEPYYMYRQKYTAGGLENVGFAKEGTFCRYNVIMMEETGDVAALGSGGVGKFIKPGGKIVRLSNPKYPLEYIERHKSAQSDWKPLRLALEND